MNIFGSLRALSSGFASARRVKRENNVSIARQFSDWLALRRNNVGISDYYYYRLFDPVLHPTMGAKLTYGGWRAFQGEFRSYSKPHLRALAYEKHVFYRLCAGFGLPVPELYAVYAPTPESFERHHAITNRQGLIDFLSSTEKVPFFGKPSSGSQGYGGVGVMAREPDGTLQLLNGENITVQMLADRIDEFASKTGTYLFTEFLHNHEELESIAGEAVCSFRVVMLVRNGEPEFFRTSVRFPGPESHTSNVVRFARGTISCNLNPETGEITLALAGAGLDRVEVTNHPASGTPLVGHRIDGWKSIRELALQASKAMSPFRMQHWDFALTPRGPVIMEMNFIGDVTACQVHGPPGIYTEQYLTFRASHARRE